MSMSLKPVKVRLVKRLLQGGSDAQIINALQKIHPSDISFLFSELGDVEIKRLIDCLFQMQKAGETLAELPEFLLPDILEQVDFEKLVKIIARLDSDDAIYFLNKLPEARWPEVLQKLPSLKRRELENILYYPKDSAGSVMSSSYFTVDIEDTVESAVAKIREHSEKESLFYIYVLDEKRLVGVLPLRSLVMEDPKKPVKDLMKTSLMAVKATDDQEYAAQMVGQYNLLALPVVNENRELLGVITVDDVIDIFEEEATEDIYHLAGLSEEDRAYTPVRTKVKKRMPWMFINLITASLGALVIGIFEHTISQVAILAALVHIIANMGGNGGNQSLVVITRSMALGELEFSKAYGAVLREAANGLIQGLVVGSAAGLLVYAWKGNYYFGIVLCISLVANLIIGAMIGSLVPMVFKWLNKDPALGSSVVVTTVTDVVGFFVFLGMAQAFLDKLV